MKKYTITKTFELPDDFVPNSPALCEEKCPFHYWEYLDRWSGKGSYVCPFYCCPLKNEDGWKCEEQIE